jgi:hypothetical protein
MNMSGVLPDQALAREVSRREREGAPPEIVEETLRALIGILVDACRLELQSGNTEQGIARVQAALEYTLLAPPFPPGGSHTLTMLLTQHLF